LKRFLTAVLTTAAVLAPSTAWAQAASPSPSSTAKPACAYAGFSVDRSVIKSGEVVAVRAERIPSQGEGNENESQRLDLRLVRRAPEPVAEVRSDTSTTTVVTWPLRLGESHTFYTEYVNQNPDKCFALGRPNGFPLQVDVQPVISIAATRTAPRAYSFTGRIQPAKGQTVTLYRHDAGRRIITAQSTVQPNGTHRFDRRFLNSGRFGFSVSVKESTAHLAGSSVVRPTVIH
jgi:hypothetical protein